MANDNKNNQQPSSDGETNDNKNNQENKSNDSKPKIKKKNLVRVRFSRAYTPYLKGEMAGFEPKEAKRLIELKVCSKA